MTGHDVERRADPVEVPRRVARLTAAAQEAEQIRSLASQPHMVALRVEQIRRQVDALLWTGVMLGLLFTMVNVQRFAAAGAPTFSSTWWTAWLLDPMVSLVLLAVLRAEQVTARYRVPPSAWIRTTKWCACLITYAMNTWEAWGFGGTPLSPAGVVLHSVPPLLVMLAAETGPALRERLTEAARHADGGAPSIVGPSGKLDRPDVTATPDRVHEPPPVPVREAVHNAVREPASTPCRESRRAAPSSDRPGRRRLLADYLAAARAAQSEAAAGGRRPDATPTWCREVTGCSAGTSVKIAAALRDDPVSSA